MTQAPQSAPAGWYPSPDGAPVQRWWDGVVWTDATLPPQPLDPWPASPVSASASTIASVPSISGWARPEPPRLGALGLATRVFVTLAGVGVPLAAGVRLWPTLADPPGWLTEDVAVAAQGTSAGLFVVAAAFWLVWQYRLANTFPPGTTRRTPGWHAVSWLVPVGAWWMPYQNVAELFTLATGRRRPAWLAAWWTLWVTGTLVAAVGVLQPWLSLVGGLLLTASVPFAWLVVARLTGATGPRREHPDA